CPLSWRSVSPSSPAVSPARSPDRRPAEPALDSGNASARVRARGRLRHLEHRRHAALARRPRPTAAHRRLAAAAVAGVRGSGWPRVRLVEEPVAAATYFTNVLGRQVPIGSVVVVHDFGAGTFDVSVVARTGQGFDVLAVDGRDDIGGLDIDAAIVAHLGQQYG